MKRFIILIVIVCLTAVSCVNSTGKPIEAIKTPVKTQKFIGRFKDNVSLYRESQDKIIIQKEQEQAFDIYSMNINKGIIDYEYTMSPQDKLLYCKQLDAKRILKVKQLGNSEENNVLILEGNTSRNIAKNIAYSSNALVSTSPNLKFVVYCAADGILNRYSLYLYNFKTEKTLQIIGTVNEELLNDMDWNICWSPDESLIVVSNNLIFNTENGKLISEINAANIIWSATGKKLAYVRAEKGYGKSICILDIDTAVSEEVFIVNQGEYLPNFLIWNDNETDLAFVTASLDEKEEQIDICRYQAIYSLDLKSKEAVRIDTALEISQEQLERLESINYNAVGSLLGVTFSNYLGSDLYVFDLNAKEYEFFLNIEYLHNENYEAYVCSGGNNLYFVQGQTVIEMNENMITRVVYKSTEAIEDVYISTNGSSMVIVEKTIDGILLRQLANFIEKNV